MYFIFGWKVYIIRVLVNYCMFVKFVYKDVFIVVYKIFFKKYF